MFPFSAIPFDAQTHIVSFCENRELLVLRRTSVAIFRPLLNREFRRRLPVQLLESEYTSREVRVYVTLLNHAAETSRALICKTVGCKLFRLRPVDLDGLTQIYKRNPHYGSAPEMELFSRVDLFVASMKRHGSIARLRQYDAKVKRTTSERRVKKRARDAEALTLTRDEQTVVDEKAIRKSIRRARNEDAAHEFARSREKHAHVKSRTVPHMISEGVPAALICTTCRCRTAAKACTNNSCGTCCGSSATHRRECRRHKLGGTTMS
jgi:hypothetical protein